MLKCSGQKQQKNAAGFLYEPAVFFCSEN